MRPGSVRFLVFGFLAFAWLLLGSGSGLAPAGTIMAATQSKVYLPLVMKPAKPSFGYGMNLSHPDNSPMVAVMGFGWVKYQLKWSDEEPIQKGHYDWTDADSRPDDSYAWNYVVRDTALGLKVVLRVDSTPNWANNNAGACAPPTNPSDYGDFMEALSKFLRGRVAAYEIWNEPNLPGEWCGRTPSAQDYVALLREAFRGVRAGDPNALVVSAGLATTAGGGGAVDDLAFLRGMYQNGARSYFDVLGSHPYGFDNPPEAMDSTGYNFFRHAEKQREVMVQNGDAEKKVWATELGWLINGCSFSGRQTVPDTTQANYLVRAYQYAYTHWDWMDVMLTFNLDFSDRRNYWLGDCDPMRWYAVTSGNYDPNDNVYYLSPRPAYDALKVMAKPTVR
ncbi:MAG: hypothetical protein ACYC3S_00230 [Chloroflexota bacterium]